MIALYLLKLQPAPGTQAKPCFCSSPKSINCTKACRKRVTRAPHKCRTRVTSVPQECHKRAHAACHGPLPGPLAGTTGQGYLPEGQWSSGLKHPPTEAGARGGWRAGRSHPPAEAGATGRCSSALRHPPVEAGATGTAWRPQARGRSPETRTRRGALPPTERLQARSIVS